ncbi:MAG: hypothetical protein J6W84_04595 [Bacteroidales bacterium]|nr:hypothetical protein [Bacteroidales bacterium]
MTPKCNAWQIDAAVPAYYMFIGENGRNCRGGWHNATDRCGKGVGLPHCDSPTDDNFTPDGKDTEM